MAANCVAASSMAANISSVPIDKLFLEQTLRQSVVSTSSVTKRRKCPRERGVQSMDSKMSIPVMPEKRPRTAPGEQDSERVRVTVRVRPPTRAEQKEEDGAPFIFLDTDKNTVILRRKGSFVDFTEFQFDAVLPSTALQVDVYNMAARAVVMDVLNGYNGTIMAYGQTGAGKTYTLSDKLSTGGGITAVEGIIPRSAAEIFERADSDRLYEYHVSMSYIQIYMEQIQDLLRPESCNMQIREGDNGVYVSGVEEIQVKSVEDCMKLLMLGDRNRCFAFTKLNAHSSRSHAIVILTVEKKAKYQTVEQKAELAERRRMSSCFLESERVLVGKLFLVDLAGSERLKKSGSEGIRASEAMSVNLSLTCLGKCISARADPNMTHVPFRDSKLTRLLQESLGGNAKTSLVINIAPCSEYLQESLSSLHFGSRAMKVATRAIVNVEEEFRVLTRNLQETLDLQDEKLQHLEYLSFKEVDMERVQASVLSKDEQLLQARQSLAEKARQVELLREEQNKFNEKFMEQLRVKDESWKNRLENVRNTATDSHQKVRPPVHTSYYSLPKSISSAGLTPRSGRGGLICLTRPSVESRSGKPGVIRPLQVDHAGCTHQNMSMQTDVLLSYDDEVLHQKQPYDQPMGSAMRSHSLVRNWWGQGESVEDPSPPVPDPVEAPPLRPHDHLGKLLGEYNQGRIEYLQTELMRLQEANHHNTEPGPLHVLSSGLAKDFAARIIQRAYRRRYLDKLHREKRKLEVVTGYQLMANSAARVLKGMKVLDDLFTKRSLQRTPH